MLGYTLGSSPNADEDMVRVVFVYTFLEYLAGGGERDAK